MVYVPSIASRDRLKKQKMDETSELIPQLIEIVNTTHETSKDTTLAHLRSLLFHNPILIQQHIHNLLPFAADPTTRRFLVELVDDVIFKLDADETVKYAVLDASFDTLVYLLNEDTSIIKRIISLFSRVLPLIFRKL